MASDDVEHSAAPLGWEMKPSGVWIDAPFKSPGSITAGQKVEFEFQGLSAEVEFTSFTDGIVRCKGEEYPCRPKAEALGGAPMIASIQEGKAKGKGQPGPGGPPAGPPGYSKGKGKAGPGGPPPGPSSNYKDKGKGKCKAQGGFAPNMKKKPKPFAFSAIELVSHQASDGHFDNAEIGKGMLNIYRSHGLGVEDPGFDFTAELDELGAAGGTALVIGVLGRLLYQQKPEDRIKVTVQAVGTGRGDAERVSYEEETQKEMTAEEHRQQTKEFVERFTKDNPPALGDRWLEAAEAYLQSQPGLDELKAKAEALISRWFQMQGDKKQTKAVSEDDRKRKEEEQRRRSEAKKLEQAQVTLHWMSLGPRSVDSVPWDAVKRTRWCSGGMGGATLVQIGDSEAVVLKSLGLNAVAEVIAGEVSSLVGVKVARSRPLASTDAEFALIIEALAAAPTDGERVHMLHHLSHAKFIIVMEYVAGCCLQGLDGNAKLQSDTAPSVLSQLGGLIALDCLLNNVDRVPAIWLNDGNFSNVMITKDDCVIGIDQQVNTIVDTKGKERYLKSVCEFVVDAAKGDTSCAAMARIRTGILENTGVELSDELCRQVLEGASAVFRRICDSSSLSEGLVALNDQMRVTFGDTSVDIGLTQLEKMTTFLIECIEAVKGAQ